MYPCYSPPQDDQIYCSQAQISTEGGRRMNTLVIYDSQYGNTERIAVAIADALRAHSDVQAIRVNQVQSVEFQGTDLLILGSPTQGWKATPATLSFLRRLSPAQLRGVAIACFDTRFQKPRWLTGSAAGVMAKEFQRMDVPLLMSPESFFVKGTEGPLEAGELDRATKWAQMLIKRVEASQPAMP